jgi:dTDP-4-amino-4,6-dideoxygalactose transaminase
MSWRVPFNRAFLTGREFGYMQEAVDALSISEGGAFVERCEAMLEAAIAGPTVLLTSSCTHALEMSGLLLDLGPGDEVVVPAFTFVTTANAFALRGARPVFADVRADTLNLDEGALAGQLTARTRAVVPVHYAGVGCEMDSILALTEPRGIPVIEDNAHGLFGTYRGKQLGTMGALATQSFHETKNFTCGKGGALLVNDESLVERARIVREKGTNRSQFLRGQVDKYTWVDLGSSYLPSNLLGAFLLAQLENREEIQRRRKEIWQRYDDALAGWAGSEGVRRPVVPGHVEQTFHMYYLLLPTAAGRDRFLEHMRERGILSVFHYVPLNLSPMGIRLGGRPGSCPVAEDAASRLARLPFYTGMTASEQDQVIEAVASFRTG